MRRIAIVFDDGDFEKLKTAKEKSGLTWDGFILERCVGAGKQGRAGRRRPAGRKKAI